MPRGRKKQQQGDGVIDMLKEGYNRVKYLVGNRARKSPKLESFLKAYGNQKIITLRVCRKPLKSAIQLIGNILTFGEIANRVKRLGYDNIFHLFLYVKLESGMAIILEKNQVVQVNPLPSDIATSEFVEVPLLRPLTLNLIFDLLEKHIPKERIYIYNVASYNCQRFVMDVLIVSGLATPELQKFVLQDASSLLKEGWLKSLAKDATDFASRLSVGIRGGSVTPYQRMLVEGR